MPRRGSRRTYALAPAACLLAAAGATGCFPSEKKGFDAPSPSRRLDAIVSASADDADPRSLFRLVEQLDSQDAAARMLAIRALEARTGTTLGYVHTDPEWKRQEAIERWMKYLESGGSGTDLDPWAGAPAGENPMESQSGTISPATPSGGTDPRQNP